MILTISQETDPDRISYMNSLLPSFNTTTNVGNPVTRFITVSLARELGILLSLSVLFPFMIHIVPVPDDARLGARLLPMFYAPLLAAIIGRGRSALILALFAPWLNWALTSHPAPLGAVVMMAELLGFVIALRLLLLKAGARWYFAAPAFLCGKIVALAIIQLFPSLIAGRSSAEWAVQSTILGAPGVAVLLLINWLVLRFYPPSSNGDGPIAA
jgi:hypothetical protein